MSLIFDASVISWAFLHWTCQDQNFTIEFWQIGPLFSGSCLCSLWYPRVLLQLRTGAYWWFECWSEVWRHSQNNQRAISSLLSWLYQTCMLQSWDLFRGFKAFMRGHYGMRYCRPVCKACPLMISTSELDLKENSGKRLGLCNEHDGGVEACEGSCRVDRDHPWSRVQVTTCILYSSKEYPCFYLLLIWILPLYYGVWKPVCLTHAVERL